VRGQRSFPDLVVTVREARASPHRSKGQQKYRSSPVAVHEKAGAQCESSDSMREAGAPSTERELQVCFPWCARPTGVVMGAPQTIQHNTSKTRSLGPRE
jgi:hypothetical protein